MNTKNQYPSPSDLDTFHTPQSHHGIPLDIVKTEIDGILTLPKLSDMTCVYFDDEPLLRLLAGKFMGKIGFKTSVSFDTSANTATPEEAALIAHSDIVITDINDTNTINDPSGGLRRGEAALSSGKIVIFVSGNLENEAVINAEFGQKYPQQYAFIAKPFGIDLIKETVEKLVSKR